MSIISRGAPLPLPVLPPLPASLPVMSAESVTQRPAVPIPHDRAGRSFGFTGFAGRQSGGADSSSSFFRGTSAAARTAKFTESTSLAGMDVRQGRVGEPHGDPGEPFASSQAPDSRTFLTPADLRAVFSVPMHTRDEDLVKGLMREMNELHENRPKRKMELMLEMSMAGRLQLKAPIAAAAEAHRRVDEQFDELERRLLIRIREARQEIAARKVALGATAPDLLKAADAYHFRQLRLRLERQRATARKVWLKATTHSGTDHASALISFAQELGASIEDEIHMLARYSPSFSEQKCAEQLQALETRRRQEFVKITHAWRQASEDLPELVGMLSEVHKTVEQRYEKIV